MGRRSECCPLEVRDVYTGRDPAAGSRSQRGHTAAASDVPHRGRGGERGVTGAEGDAHSRLVADMQRERLREREREIERVCSICHTHTW